MLRSASIQTENTDLKSKYLKITGFIIKMMSAQKFLRPDCGDLLLEKNFWTMSIDELKKFIVKDNYRDNLVNETFHQKFIKTKLALNRVK